MIVDGYNIIGHWDELKLLKEKDLGSARQQLISTLAAFYPWCWERIIVVFDGQKFAWAEEGGIEVVFTESTETADTLIERLAGGLAASYFVQVATSDFAERLAAGGLGAQVLPAAVLKEVMAKKRAWFNEKYLKGGRQKKLKLHEVLHKEALAALKKYKGL